MPPNQNAIERVAVGSLNPTKIEAARRVVAQLWPQAELIPVSVPSGVAPQPMNDAETIQGAENRARSALRATHADLGIGIEGGVQATPYGMFVGGWAVIVDQDGRMGVGSGGRMLLPDAVASQLHPQAELGPVMDRASGRDGIGTKEGAIGLLTKGLIDRTDALEVAVKYATSRFLAPEYYES